jgi:hypothetical protein
MADVREEWLGAIISVKGAKHVQHSVKGAKHVQHNVAAALLLTR